MSLVPYTITALAESDAGGTGGKNIVEGAVCSMYLQPSDTVVTLYDDAAGSNGSASKLTGTNGQVVVYVERGTYRLSVNGSDSYIEIDSDVRTFDNIDDMKAANLTAGDTALCLRYYAGGNLVDGLLFETKATGTADGNVNHDLANGAKAFLIYKGPLDVCKAGLVGDGSTDNSLKITSIASDFKNLYFPAGTYNLTGTSLSISTQNDVTLRGDGFQSKIVRTDGGSVIQITGCNRVVIDSLYVQGVNTSLVVGAGNISLTNCTQFLINGNRVVNSSRQGIRTENCQNGTISNNIVSGSWQDGIIVRTNSERVNVVGNTCYSNGDAVFAPPVGEGIHLFDAPHCTVVGNTCHSNSDHGIAVEGGDYSTITGNTCYDNVVAGCSINLEGSHVNQGMIVNNNVFEGNGTSGVVFGTTTGVAVQNNTIANNGNYGVEVNAGSGGLNERLLIKDNYILDNTNDGVFLDWNANDCLISGNYIRGSANIGILINRVSSSDNQVYDNKVEGFSVEQITDNGTATRLRNNDVGNKLSGSATLSSGTASVSFSTPEPKSNYVVHVSGSVNETFWISAAAKTGFTINSSNASSSATVKWAIVDSNA